MRETSKKCGVISPLESNFPRVVSGDSNLYEAIIIMQLGRSEFFSFDSFSIRSTAMQYLIVKILPVRTLRYKIHADPFDSL